MNVLGNFTKRLACDVSGLAITEFALSLPLVMLAGLGGVELANYSVTTMRISQLAIQIADNSSRIGEKSELQSRRIYEADVNDLLTGSNIQSGSQLGLFEHGRVVISSLEVNSSDQQYIHWQRCMGKKRTQSSYGMQGDTFAVGMGPAGEEVSAFSGEAVMFVEIAYDYQPLVSAKYVGTPTIRAIASFTVRANRDLTQIYQRNPSAPDPVASCSQFDNRFSA